MLDQRIELGAVPDPTPPGCVLSVLTRRKVLDWVAVSEATSAAVVVRASTLSALMAISVGAAVAFVGLPSTVCALIGVMLPAGTVVPVLATPGMNAITTGSSSTNGLSALLSVMVTPRSQ